VRPSRTTVPHRVATVATIASPRPASADSGACTTELPTQLPDDQGGVVHESPGQAAAGQLGDQATARDTGAGGLVRDAEAAHGHSS
jgi:hypothetical protein